MKSVFVATVLCFALAVSGCATVVSKEFRMQADSVPDYMEVKQNPDAYQGRKIIWAGTIVASKNQKEGTLLEILHQKTDVEGRPKDIDSAEGRFLAIYESYLDVAVYAQGREVTVAGELQGQRVLPLGEIEYAYPLVSAKEIHLWPVKTERPYPYAYPPYPWWWYYPYRDYWYW
jgi:outer membrane lipoprotein